MPKLLGQLVGGKLNPTQHLETQQALVKQLAEILEFVLKFDEYKVSGAVTYVANWMSLCGYNLARETTPTRRVWRATRGSSAFQTRFKRVSCPYLMWEQQPLDVLASLPTHGARGCIFNWLPGRWAASASSLSVRLSICLPVSLRRARAAAHWWKIFDSAACKASGVSLSPSLILIRAYTHALTAVNGQANCRRFSEHAKRNEWIYYCSSSSFYITCPDGGK